MIDLNDKTDLTPLPFRGGVGGGACQPSATLETKNKPHRPTPTSPLKARGLTPKDNNKRLGQTPTQGRGKNWNIPADCLTELHKRAKEMRRNPTEPEKRLWRYLSNSQLEGFKFRRQDVIWYYIADFACPSAKLIVEVDADTHDEAKDRLRDDKLAEFGFRVLRVTNTDVLHNMEGVLVHISLALREAERPHPNPSPEGEGLMSSYQRSLVLVEQRRRHFAAVGRECLHHRLVQRDIVFGRAFIAGVAELFSECLAVGIARIDAEQLHQIDDRAAPVEPVRP